MHYMMVNGQRLCGMRWLEVEQMRMCEGMIRERGLRGETMINDMKQSPKFLIQQSMCFCKILKTNHQLIRLYQQKYIALIIYKKNSNNLKNNLTFKNMGNTQPDTQNCKYRVYDIIDESKIQIQRLNPFSKKQEQVPYAEPLEENIFRGSVEDQSRLNGIIEAEQIRRPEKFVHNDGYQYDEKFWKKQSLNAVIQGHWYRRVPHGLSKFYFPGGKRVFVSYFDQGVPIFDECLIVFETGSYYHGGLRNFKFDGYGKYVNEDENVVIEGEWKEGVPMGRVKETLVSGGVVSGFEGEFGAQGEKHGQKCVYTVRNVKNMGDVVFEYQGNFENGEFAGDSVVKTANGKHEIQTIFKGDIVQVKSLETQQFQFQGQFEKDLSNGHARFRDIKTNSRVIYQGTIHNGLLDGPGAIIHEDNSTQKVHWHQGLKLKHLRNFQNLSKLNELIHRIQEAYQRASTYTEMAKILADQYKQLQTIQTMEGLSTKGQHESFLFEMISREKANTIGGGQKVGPVSPLKHPKKELIVELEGGKFLYVTCFKMHPSEKVQKVE